MAWYDYLAGAIPGAAGAGNMISSFLHPERGYKAAGEEMEKYYRDAQGNLQPYNQHGLDQYDRLTQQANALNDPAKLQADWSKNYEMSPQAQQELAESKESGLGAASSMGLMGSSAALNNIQQGAGNIMQKDRQAYMDDLMKKYMASIGIGQNIYDTGAGTASNMSQNSMNMGGNMAGLAYNRINAPGENFAKIAGPAIGAGINYMTGGVSGGGTQPAYWQR